MFDAQTLYGGAPPAQPTGRSAPPPAGEGEPVGRTRPDEADGDPLLLLMIMIGLAVALGWLSISVQVGR